MPRCLTVARPPFVFPHAPFLGAELRGVPMPHSLHVLLRFAAMRRISCRRAEHASFLPVRPFFAPPSTFSCFRAGRGAHAAFSHG